MTKYKGNTLLSTFYPAENIEYKVTRDSALQYRVYYNGTQIWKGVGKDVRIIIEDHMSKIMPQETEKPKKTVKTVKKGKK